MVTSAEGSANIMQKKLGIHNNDVLFVIGLDYEKAFAHADWFRLLENLKKWEWIGETDD